MNHYLFSLLNLKTVYLIGYKFQCAVIFSPINESKVYLKQSNVIEKTQSDSNVLTPLRKIVLSRELQISNSQSGLFYKLFIYILIERSHNIFLRVKYFHLFKSLYTKMKICGTMITFLLYNK
jgi:hypothetical protein